MAKPGRRKDPQDAARRKLSDAQAKLQSAQERRTRAINAGDVEIERARARVEARLEKATKEVERRSGRVARAEARLSALQADRPRAKSRATPSTTPPEVSSPEAAASRLEDLQVAVIEERQPPAIAIPGSIDLPEDETVAATSVPEGSDLRLLSALRDGFSEGGATYTEWLQASHVSKRTFLRARTRLLDAGLVTRNGDGQGARYAATDAASRHLAPDR